MKAADVRVLPALDHGESYVDPAFLLVETRMNEQGETVTSINHVCNDSVSRSKRGWQVKTLGHSVHMTHPAAREWAVSYAASREVPIVYERDETAA